MGEEGNCLEERREANEPVTTRSDDGHDAQHA